MPSDQFEVVERCNRPVNIHPTVTPFSTGCDRHLLRTSAFILAGGQGERLYPLTQSRPKPAVSPSLSYKMYERYNGIWMHCD